MSGIPGQWGRGSLREQFIGTTPSDLVDQLTDKNFHTKNFPRDTQDSAPATGPLGPVAKATTKHHQYEIFMCSANFPTGEGAKNASRSPLLAGNVHTFRATFQPQLWEIYTFQSTGTVAGDLLYFDCGTQYPSPPCDVLVSVTGNGDKRTIPGRGDMLSVYAPTTNTGTIHLVVKAISALDNAEVGAVDE